MVQTYLNGAKDPEYRTQVSEVILGSKSPFPPILNPFEVRRRASWTDEEPEYFLAIAYLKAT